MLAAGLTVSAHACMVERSLFVMRRINDDITSFIICVQPRFEGLEAMLASLV